MARAAKLYACCGRFYTEEELERFIDDPRAPECLRKCVEVGVVTEAEG